MNSTRRMLICEEALKDYNGHWFEYNKAVVEMNRENGVDVRILAHRDAGADILSALDAEPYFQWTNWDQIYYHPSAWRRYLGILVHNWRVFWAVRQHLKKSDPYELVFVPTVVVFHLIAWWFLAKLYGEKAKRIVLLIRNSAAAYENEGEEPTFSKSSGILRFVLRRYRKMIAKGTVRFASDSHRLAEEYRKLADIGVIVVPHPCLLFESRKLFSESPQDAPLNFCLLGPARWEKGIQIFLEALRILKNQHSPQWKLVIQWPDEVVSPSGERLDFDPSEFAGRGLEIEVLDSPLSSEAYQQLLSKTDVMVLPYLRQSYFARISGVAVEAILSGIPVIYTEDTWNSDMVERFGAGVGFSNESAKELAEALLKVSDDFAKVKSQAIENAILARKHFSDEEFREALWKH